MRYKPVLVAGFFVFFATTSLAQDYIDVEAEREAARDSELSFGQGASSAPVTTNAAFDTPPAAVSVAPANTDSVYSSAGGSDNAIRPYSGTTWSAPPISESSDQIDQPASAGGVVIQLQQLQAEVRRLNGIVEQQTQEIRVLKEQSLERYIDLDRRLAEVGAAAGTGAPINLVDSDDSVADGGLVAAPGTAVASVDAQPGEEAMYRDAYELVKIRDFDGAVSGFKGFLGSYPFGKYAPNAHYWLGELYLVIEPADPELARQSFKLLLDQYPSNAKVPDALYKLGRVYYLKGNQQRSREYLNRVIEEYGAQRHPAAQLAQDFLDQNF